MALSKTNEQALEAAIERALAGITTEELKKLGLSLPQRPQGGHGFYIGNPSDFNPKYAIDERRFWHFLEHTQKEELEKLKRYPDWKQRILSRYDRMIRRYGVIKLLREGLKVENAEFTLFYPLPPSGSSETAKRNFEKNEFSITRQVRYNLNNPNEAIDIVLFVNGIAIITMELKNPWTGQTAAFHGINQYKNDRDPRQPLLSFGRCIVHFAVDTDEVYMTTKLEGKKTFFLPFNKGYRNGKGNPPNPRGHKTAYLWEKILTRQSLADIIQNFVQLEGNKSDPLQKKKLIFPRYHQLDVVRKLVHHAQHNGIGQKYLIQHSAGSGKSNSITWLAYRLLETYPAKKTLPGVRSKDDPLFDSVVVVTDRRLLDKQLKDNIRQFSQVEGIVAHANTSRDLKQALEQGKRLIITTIQKFPYIVDAIGNLSHKRFAVIIDEAHSSQTGISASKMNQALGSGKIDSEEELIDIQDLILRTIEARKMQKNVSYFAFTATPKNSTLERFGTQQEDGSFRPFHLYSMKQAIEEGFILDVLTNYTTYRSYYEIQKSIEDNPEFETAKAQRKLKAFVEKDPRTIAVKAEIILDHFINKVFRPKKLKGQAKGMVVTQNIETAIRYYFALKEILREKGDPFKILIAFSGSKIVDGIEYTEESLNGFPEKDTRDKFDLPQYRLLVVANKYLTGFDQPKLCALYVDKKLQGVLAVQALSRLNRICHECGKKAEDLFILDFYNTIEDIKEAFDPYYTATTLREPTDVNILHDLESELSEYEVYYQQEVNKFSELFFTGADAQQLSPIIDRAAQRFNQELDLDEKSKAEFKIKAKHFVKLYPQIAAIVPYAMPSWEKLFWFLKFLIPKLIVRTKEDDQLDELLEAVDLSTYAIERKELNTTIELDPATSELDPRNPNPRGAKDDPQKDPLDEIIRQFNERWFQDWQATDEEKRVKLLAFVREIKNHPDYQEKFEKNTDPYTRDLVFARIFEDVQEKEREKDLSLYRLLLQEEFKISMIETLKRMIRYM